jgi:catechol 2,3-dioxygenase-like lactoylglutathione lyase family enzyme
VIYKTPRVGATRINHVSIAARDLEESTRFYEEVLSMERIPTPTFRGPVQWLRVGDMQIHLFLYDGPAPERHHLGITIDDFDAAYEAVKARASDTLGWKLVELPSGQVQLYFRDPADNLVELNWADVDTLDRSRYPELERLADHVEQRPSSQGAELYLSPRSH